MAGKKTARRNQHSATAAPKTWWEARGLKRVRLVNGKGKSRMAWINAAGQEETR